MRIRLPNLTIMVTVHNDDADLHAHIATTEKLYQDAYRTMWEHDAEARSVIAGALKGEPEASGVVGGFYAITDWWNVVAKAITRLRGDKGEA